LQFRSRNRQRLFRHGHNAGFRFRRIDDRRWRFFDRGFYRFYRSGCDGLGNWQRSGDGAANRPNTALYNWLRIRGTDRLGHAGNGRQHLEYHLTRHLQRRRRLQGNPQKTNVHNHHG
jgi:hypothetical protein